MLTRFLDLVEEGLSYLQLFLELPETVWSLQNRSYIKKHNYSGSVSGFTKANLSFGLIYELSSPYKCLGCVHEADKKVSVVI